MLEIVLIGKKTDILSNVHWNGFVTSASGFLSVQGHLIAHLVSEIQNFHFFLAGNVKSSKLSFCKREPPKNSASFFPFMEKGRGCSQLSFKTTFFFFFQFASYYAYNINIYFNLIKIFNYSISYFFWKRSNKLVKILFTNLKDSYSAKYINNIKYSFL